MLEVLQCNQAKASYFPANDHHSLQLVVFLCQHMKDFFDRWIDHHSMDNEKSKNEENCRFTHVGKVS